MAVFDGEKFTATGDKEVADGQKVHTMWGWLAWQLGPAAYKVVRKHDEDRVAPAGDEIKAMLEREGKPVLLAPRRGAEIHGASCRAWASRIRRSNGRPRTFLQNLTVEVSNSPHAVMVYSLQRTAAKRRKPSAPWRNSTN